MKKFIEMEDTELLKLYLDIVIWSGFFEHVKSHTVEQLISAAKVEIGEAETIPEARYFYEMEDFDLTVDQRAEKAGYWGKHYHKDLLEEKEFWKEADEEHEQQLEVVISPRRAEKKQIK